MTFKETLISEIERLESLPISQIPNDIDDEIDFNITLNYLKLAMIDSGETI